jgi:class 3 adenylate cyclase/tetratricopeptide (TPR) repeat protein
MKCPKCQFENREGAKFCKECGKKLELACPQCGNPYKPGARFCDECGQCLTKAKETSPIDYTQPHSYTPKHLADKILTTRSSIEGERKLVTVLFADVANFTSLSEKLDPEEVHQIMDGCFKILLDEIHQYEGTINQFTGDGVMALFGAPVAHEDHAQRACHAALSIQKAIGEYGDKVAKDFSVEFKMRIGVNSGPVIVGAIGDDLRMDYTAVGDTTNLASRMQSLAQPGAVLLSKHTNGLVKDYFDLRSLGKLEVKGKEEPQEAFELLKPGGAATRLEAAVARGLTKFVGRQNSMGILTESYEKTKNGTGQVVGIVGEAGVGKSRLLYEFRNRLPQGKSTYLEGRCIHFGGAMPYLPILDILRSYFEIGEGERETVIRKRARERIVQLDEKLQGMVPPIQDLLSLKVEDEAYLKLEPRQRKEKVFEALRDLIVRVSQERPLVLAIEDLHWIDKTSEEFLDYFIGWIANVKVMLALLYRPEYTHQWGNRSYFNRVGVDQLTLKSSAELVKAILDGGEAEKELRELILGRAAGNPLFMEELTHTLLENGSIQKEQDRYVLARKPSELQVPDTVQGIIAARIDRLEENLKRIMQVASVIGREFAFRILQTIVGMREELKTHLLTLQGLEFIYEKQLFPELEYIFKHALTQEVAYNSLLRTRRQEIHRKIGKAIEALYAERVEEFYEMLAYHYSRSEDKLKACHYLKLAGDKAWSSSSASEAFSFYKEAIKLLQDQAETQRNLQTRLEILKSIGYPIRMLGFPEGSFQFLEEGERLAQHLMDPKAQAYFQTNIGIYFLIAGGDPAKGRLYIERGMEGSELTDAIDIIVPATDDLISYYIIEGNYPRVCQIAPKLIALIEKTQTEGELFGRPSNQYSIVNGYYGMALGAVGKFSEGKRFLDKGRSFALDMNNPISIAQVEMTHGAFYFFQGDAEKMLRHWLSSAEYMEKSQFRMFQGPVWAWVGLAYLHLGLIDKARQFAEKGLEMHMHLGMNVWLGSIHGSLGEIYLALGNSGEALKHAEMGVNLCRKNNERFFESEARIILGRVVAAKGSEKEEEAQEQILQSLMMLEELQIKPRYAVGLLYLGELLTKSGKGEMGIEKLRKAEEMFHEMRMDHWLDRVQGILRGPL